MVSGSERCASCENRPMQRRGKIAGKIMMSAGGEQGVTYQLAKSHSSFLLSLGLALLALGLLLFTGHGNLLSKLTMGLFLGFSL